ncbi:hypothetical protein L9F63_022702, partial [Diploptera punctata]
QKNLQFTIGSGREGLTTTAYSPKIFIKIIMHVVSVLTGGRRKLHTIPLLNDHHQSLPYFHRSRWFWSSDVLCGQEPPFFKCIPFDCVAWRGAYIFEYFHRRRLCCSVVISIVSSVVLLGASILEEYSLVSIYFHLVLLDVFPSVSIRIPLYSCSVSICFHRSLFPSISICFHLFPFLSYCHRSRHRSRFRLLSPSYVPIYFHRLFSIVVKYYHLVFSVCFPSVFPVVISIVCFHLSSSVSIVVGCVAWTGASILECFHHYFHRRASILDYFHLVSIVVVSPSISIRINSVELRGQEPTFFKSIPCSVFHRSRISIVSDVLRGQKPPPFLKCIPPYVSICFHLFPSVSICIPVSICFHCSRFVSIYFHRSRISISVVLRGQEPPFLKVSPSVSTYFHCCRLCCSVVLRGQEPTILEVYSPIAIYCHLFPSHRVPICFHRSLFPSVFPSVCVAWIEAYILEVVSISLLSSSVSIVVGCVAWTGASILECFHRNGCVSWTQASILEVVFPCFHRIFPSISICFLLLPSVSIEYLHLYPSVSIVTSDCIPCVFPSRVSIYFHRLFPSISIYLHLFPPISIVEPTFLKSIPLLPSYIAISSSDVLRCFHRSQVLPSYVSIVLVFPLWSDVLRGQEPPFLNVSIVVGCVTWIGASILEVISIVVGASLLEVYSVCVSISCFSICFHLVFPSISIVV